MCLAVPAKIVTLDGGKAEVDMMGNRTTADVSVLPDIKIGDYVMVHAGFAIQKYDAVEAEENLSMIRDMAEKGNI